jgi:hypothetical protein
MTTTVEAPVTTVEPKTWTIAYRRRTANRFQRVTNWSGTWAEAREMAGAFGELYPDLQVWYTMTAAHEQAETIRLAAKVASGEYDQEFADRYLEDHRNIMVDSGKRIAIRETGNLPAELLDADAMKVAGEMLTPTVPAFSTWIACLDWAGDVRTNHPAIFADMVRDSRTADERYSASCTR